MKIEKEKDKSGEVKSKEISRREFLKDAGLVVGGAAIGSLGLASACSSTITTTQTETQTKTVAQTQNGTVTISKAAETTTAPPTTVTVVSVLPKSNVIAWNADECMACGRCLMACATYHEKAVSPPLSGIIWVDGDEFSGLTFRQPLFCQQCSAPECYYACPQKDKALCIDAKTGARYINKANCLGDGLCAMACPLGPSRINMDPVQKKAIKCDMCKDRPGGPVCVEVCDRQALRVVAKEERV